jgi:MarR family transcriptional regulator, organic hydroperoxide resistance regulator
MAARPETRRDKARKPPARPPKTGIGMLLRDADAAFNRYLRARLALHGVTFGQFQHLRNLWVENGLTQAELSRRIGIEMASSTAILDSLESEKLITRVRNAADRRKINVFLTPAGAALEAPLMACAADANKRASKGLTKAEVAQLFAVAGRIIENFKTLRTAVALSGKSLPRTRSGVDTDLGFTRDRHSKKPKSAKADLGGLPQKMRPTKDAEAPRGRVRRNMPRAAE